MSTDTPVRTFRCQAPLSACGVPFECLTFRSAQSAAVITSRPGALDITGLEPRNPFALVLGLSFLALHAGSHGYWAAAFLTFLEFVHAFLKAVATSMKSTLTPSSTDNTKRYRANSKTLTPSSAPAVP